MYKEGTSRSKILQFEMLNYKILWTIVNKGNIYS